MVQALGCVVGLWLALTGTIVAQGPEQGAGQDAEQTREERGRRLKTAIDAAHAWLAAHQDEDGGFSASMFLVHDPKGEPCDGPGKPDQDVYVTSLVIKSCYGVGSLPNKGEHQQMVTRALDWLLAQQREDGWFCDPALPYGVRNHAVACSVMRAGGGYASKAEWTAAAQRGIAAAAGERIGDRGWPHTKGAETPDAETTAWLESAQDGNADATLALLQNGPPEAAGRAACLYTLTWHGHREAPALIKARADLCEQRPFARPTGGRHDPRVWYFGSQAIQFTDAATWQRWSDQLVAVALPLQRTKGSAAGTWDPEVEHGSTGGRIYATAMTILALEVAWRKDHRDR